jgi:tRNA(Ile)-lysidine synthetase-like protein
MDYLQIQGLLLWSLEGQSGQILTLPKKVEARKEFSHLILVARSVPSGGSSERKSGTPEPNYRYEVQVPSMVSVPEAKLALQFEFIPLIAGQARYNEGGTVLLDGKLAGSPLLLRNWQAGDAYQPQGHRNKKKLRDLLQRARIPVRDRAAWPVLTAGEQIIWVRGLVVAEGRSPASDSTQAVGIREIGAE